MASSYLTCDDTLPSAATAVDFLDSTFFRQLCPNGSRPSLPTPADVRALNGDFTWGKVAFTDLGLFVKYGSRHQVPIDEARTLRSLGRDWSSRPSAIAIPELFGWRSEDGINYMYMSLIHGVTLDEAWESLTDDDKECMSAQLQYCIEELRLLKPCRETGSFVGSVSRGPSLDNWFGGRRDAAGPFVNAKEFNDFVQFASLYWLPMSQRPPDPLRPLLPDTARICFTHADLHLHNILISDEDSPRHIVGIVDWGQAGWYPEYWEYCKAALLTYDIPRYTEGWLLKTMQAYDDEFEAFCEYWACNPA